MKRVILGISAFHGDSSAALVVDGQLVAAVEEERFRRIKHWAGFPSESIKRCLEIGGVSPAAVTDFAIARDPNAHLLRKALFVASRLPSPRLVGDRARNSGRIRNVPGRVAETLGLDSKSVSSRTHWVEHHPAHLASAYYASPFEEAAVCAIDGFGDFVSTSYAVGRGPRLDVVDRVHFPHSLGMLYLAITQFLGFTKYGDEYKVMGLAPYGSPEHAEKIRKLLRLRPKGRFELDLSYFRHHTGGVNMTWDEGEPTMGAVYSKRMEELLGKRRDPKEAVAKKHEDLAASLQVVFEEAQAHVLNGLAERTRMSRLAFAGGCAMNSVANGKIRERTDFKEVFIQPAAGDAGTSLGAALYVHNMKGGTGPRFVMHHSYWGPSFDDASHGAAIKARETDLLGQHCTFKEFPEEEALCSYVAGRISEGAIVGWFQGRMEWGARALGNRSILADPRRADMREIINTKIKFRERFRPFAPSILKESLSDFFVDAVPDPFMIQVYPVRADKRTIIPAVTHVDESGRLQTVDRAANPRYWLLLKHFEKRTGVPVLLNTSFNENEPIVHRPEEALDCFLRTKMDVLALGNRVLEKRT
ncbi:MAG: carbamoyltransferase [Euryarchaeota archaeon]|nr:carbamoyltransferase [Euryarchaeota archaeon]